MPKQTGTPGNTMQSQADFDHMLYKIGVAISRLERWCSTDVPEGVYVKSIRLRAPQNPEGEWLAVVSISTENGGKVGFHSAEDLTAVLSGLSNRLRNGSIKWKDDEYA